MMCHILLNFFNTIFVTLVGLKKIRALIKKILLYFKGMWKIVFLYNFYQKHIMYFGNESEANQVAYLKLPSSSE